EQFTNRPRHADVRFCEPRLNYQRREILPLRPAVKSTDIRIDDVAFSYEDYRYRTPIKFGGVATDRVTLLNVNCQVRTRGGKSAQGLGSMPVGNVWAYPSRRLGYEDTLSAMKALVDRVAGLTRACTETGHPIDLTHALEPEYHRAAAELSLSLAL